MDYWKELIIKKLEGLPVKNKYYKKDKEQIVLLIKNYLTDSMR